MKWLVAIRPVRESLTVQTRKIMWKIFVLILIFVIECRSVEDIVIRTIKRDGYSPKVARVKTVDGYVLTLLRITRVGYENRKPRDVVFMMHCLMCSCGAYIAGGQNQSLAYQFANEGYEVWLGNARGTRFSDEHSFLRKNSPKFWDYSLHEIGSIDLPTMIDLVLKRTRRNSLHYVGHSMGGALFMIMMATQPEYVDKIKAAFLMAPAMVIGDSFSTAVQTAVAFYPTMKRFFGLVNYRYFPVDQILLRRAEEDVRRTPSLRLYTDLMYFNVMGPDTGISDRKKLPRQCRLSFDVMSVKQIDHFYQIYTTGQFRTFDYNNKAVNYRHYNTPKAPKYNITVLPKTLVTFFGTGDGLVTYDNSKIFLRRVKVTKNYYLKGFNHFDMMFGRGIKKHIFDRMIQHMRASRRN